MKHFLLALLLMPGSAWARQAGKKKEVEFQKRVDAAIEKGLRYLKGSEPSPPGFDIGETYHLALWTYVHAGVPETDPEFQKLFKRMLGEELAATYKVALEAMILEEVDRVKYQERIAQCGQFLVDNMSPIGQWGYGTPTTYDKFLPVPTGTPRRAVGTGGGKPPPSIVDFARRQKPPVRMKIRIKKKRDGATHDNSNTQYAALGLRACHDAGIEFEKSVLERARKWWIDCQIKEEGPGEDKSAATGGGRGFPAVGWCYSEGGAKAHCAPGCGAMTAGAVGALCILDYMLDGEEKRTWKQNPAVSGGFSWLTRNFSVTQNPGVCDMGGAGVH